MSISVGTTYSSSGASASSLTFSVTVDATANNVLVVTFTARAGGGQTISSVTFNGNAMTQAVYLNDNGGLKNVEGGTYYATGVAATTANVVVTMSSACAALYAEAVPIYGASGLGATASLYQGSTASNTDSITTTKVNSVIIGSAIKAGGGGSGDTLVDNGGQTTWGKTSLGSNPNNSQSAAAYVTTTTIGSYSLGWSWTTNTENVGTVIEIKEVAALTFSTTETATLTETIATQIGRIFSIAETATLTEAKTIIRGAVISIIETLSLSEVFSSLVKWLRQAKSSSSMSNTSKSSASIWTDDSKHSSSITNQTKTP